MSPVGFFGPFLAVCVPLLSPSIIFLLRCIPFLTKKVKLSIHFHRLTAAKLAARVELSCPLASSGAIEAALGKTNRSMSSAHVFPSHVFPWYLRADAEALFTRWLIGDFDSSLFRGIKSVKGVIEGGKKRLNHSLENSLSSDWRAVSAVSAVSIKRLAKAILYRIHWINKLKKSANVIGDNGLVNGQ
jgi:hypothetical protein